MFSIFVFILAGVVLAALILAKMYEIKGSDVSRRLFVLKAISKGDERARDLYKKGLHFYSDGKHQFLFFVQKQLPTKARIYTNRALTKLQEMSEERFGNIRNSRLINRKEGISEFFKNISEVEKGGGELHDDVYVEPTIDEAPLAYRITPIAPATSTSETRVKTKKPRASRKPRVKKLQVVEVVEY